MVSCHVVCRRKVRPPSTKVSEALKRDIGCNCPHKRTDWRENILPTPCLSAENVYLDAREGLPLSMRERERENINNSLICKLLEEFFFRKSTSKDGIKRKPVPTKADTDIPLYVFTFLFILLVFLYLLYIIHRNRIWVDESNNAPKLNKIAETERKSASFFAEVGENFKKAFPHSFLFILWYAIRQVHNGILCSSPIIKGKPARLSACRVAYLFFGRFSPCGSAAGNSSEKERGDSHGRTSGKIIGLTATDVTQGIRTSICL